MKLSASSLQRIDACPASAALPQVTHDSGAAERGTEIHAYQARRAQGMPAEQALELVPEAWRTTCAELAAPAPGMAEVAFAYDVATGKARVIGHDVGREYGKLAPTEIPGSADLVELSSGAADVTDYKTGRTEVPPARENLQLHFLGLASSRAYGVKRVTVGLLHIREDGSSYPDRCELDAFDLAAIAARLQRLVERVRKAEAQVAVGEQPDVHEGSHCVYCPARNACPAKVGWLVRLTVPEGIRQRFQTLLTGQTDRQAYELVERATEVLNDLHAQLYQWARENPIDLGDGRVFGVTVLERESVDGQVAWRVLQEQFGDQVADAAVELSSSKAAIERALRPVAPKGSLATLKRKALEAIEKAGGIDVKRSETVKEHRPAKAEGESHAAKVA